MQGRSLNKLMVRHYEIVVKNEVVTSTINIGGPAAGGFSMQLDGTACGVSTGWWVTNTKNIAHGRIGVVVCD